MEFTKNAGGGGGSWLDKKELKTGDTIKLVSEATEQEGTHGAQIVVKCKVKDKTTEAVNIAINTPSKNALIDAFGSESTNWMDKTLTAHIENLRIGGKAVIALYLVPEGYAVKDDEGGYLVIEKGEKVDAGEITGDEIPF